MAQINAPAASPPLISNPALGQPVNTGSPSPSIAGTSGQQHHSQRRWTIWQYLPKTEAIKKYGKPFVAFLGLLLAGLALISVSPAFQSVGLARIANDYSKEGTELAEWSALLAFKQDCEDRTVASKPVAANCSEIIATVMPPPPHSYSVPFQRLVKRTVHTLSNAYPTLTERLRTLLILSLIWTGNIVLRLCCFGIIIVGCIVGCNILLRAWYWRYQAYHLLSCKLEETTVTTPGEDLSCFERDHENQTNNRFDATTYLAQLGADVNPIDTTRTTPLMFAAEEGLLDLVAALVERGGDVHRSMMPLRITALHLACSGQSKDLNRREFAPICRRLIEAGADVDCADWAQRTPLHRAMKFFPNNVSDSELVSVLVECGANPDLRDEDGNVPMTKEGLTVCQLADMGRLTLEAVQAMRMDSLQTMDVLTTAKTSGREEATGGAQYRVTRNS